MTNRKWLLVLVEVVKGRGGTKKEMAVAIKWSVFCLFSTQGPTVENHRAVFSLFYYRNIATATTAFQKRTVENTFGLNLKLGLHAISLE